MSATSTTPDGLALRGVSLRLGDGEEYVQALDGVDLTVARGEFAAVVGPSGAGKSSLLAVAGGLTRPTSGTVTVAGRDLLAGSRRDRARLRREEIGFVFQSGNLIPALTAAEQLVLPTRWAGRGGRRGPGARTLLADLGLADKADRRPDRLSGGERQRVGIARALVTAPSLVLADEPTASLDRARSHEVVALLAREARARNVAAVMVTHDLDVLAHCDTVYEMIDGRLTRAQ
ncbi:putative ABC transport system ATP-binding protein [Actinocorallia herbida]|uniref:Putative ABC transport system ATP-binding protein n=1 Tax=Actinocorallia herbida TaxID=58109 RepID=A0A3N1D6C3_9ACTN|nr:ABC transporter ATP-binding protein [Actinocorallia herbida]ROO89016.1 putative ABC transport system ATP-binding protein [Actinocorallia herbida]